MVHTILVPALGYWLFWETADHLSLTKVNLRVPGVSENDNSFCKGGQALWLDDLIRQIRLNDITVRPPRVIPVLL